MDEGFYWLVQELVNFELSAPVPFPVEARNPKGCVGYFPVFTDYEEALRFVDYDGAKVRCFKVEAK